MTIIDSMLLTAMVVAAIWTVMTRSLLKSAIGLALTSAVITIIMFRLNSPFAAVFELSVCTGLITAVFISTISLVKPLTHKQIVQLSKDRIKRFWYLPATVIVVGIVFIYLKIQMPLSLFAGQAEGNARDVLWNSRQLDLFGQIAVLLAGVFGVVILFKETKKK